MKSRNFIWIIFILIIACKKSPLPEPQTGTTWQERLDQHLEMLLSEEKVPAISLAVFTPDTILYHRALGLKDLDTREPIDANTVFEAASLSKTVFAYLVMEMANAGQIDLDQPIDSLEWVDIGLSDQRRAGITPRMILAHQTALPNWRGPIHITATNYQDLFSNEDTLTFIDTPGIGFHYSGEGYLWLQLVVEKQWQMDLRAYANRRLFDPLGLSRTSFLFDERVTDNAANGHLGYTATTDRLQFYLPVAAGSLHSNALDYSHFFQHLLREIERSDFYAKMLDSEVQADDKENYTVSWGLGIGQIRFNNKTYLFHWGDNRIFKAYYLYSLIDKKGVVFFVNCQEGLRVQPGLVELVFGEKVPMWPEEYLK